MCASPFLHSFVDFQRDASKYEIATPNTWNIALLVVADYRVGEHPVVLFGAHDARWLARSRHMAVELLYDH